MCGVLVGVRARRVWAVLVALLAVVGHFSGRIDCYNFLLEVFGLYVSFLRCGSKTKWPFVVCFGGCYFFQGEYMAAIAVCCPHDGWNDDDNSSTIVVSCWSLTRGGLYKYDLGEG